MKTEQRVRYEVSATKPKREANLFKPMAGWFAEQTMRIYIMKFPIRLCSIEKFIISRQIQNELRALSKMRIENDRLSRV
ncbi:hypothetical protein J21TS3_41090 [Paenibacillus cookii]|uniref:Uncharacterized protein n=1 Tax=Paenibacillus cookii TaxID=157839 RepID=A0ABQ4M2B0_9BACL|nr:hypothetical protein J21TS3_41090 [Paenibacillus cookii]